MAATYSTLPLPFVFGVPECSWYQLSFIGLVLAFTPFFARVWRLWFLYFASREKLEHEQEIVWPSGFRDLAPEDGEGVEDNSTGSTSLNESRSVAIIVEAVDVDSDSETEQCTSQLPSTPSETAVNEESRSADAQHRSGDAPGIRRKGRVCISLFISVCFSQEVSRAHHPRKSREGSL